MNEETKLIGKVVLTEFELSQAYSYLYEEFGPIIQIWTDEKKNEMVSNYWLENGKSDMSFLNDIEDE